MASERYRHPNLEPLPADVDRSLAAIDERLAEEAGRATMPAGLVDRVFDASVDLLPRRQARPAIAGRLPMSRSAWGRLAMAASLAVAFVLGARALNSPRPVPLADPVVKLTRLSHDAELALIDSWGADAAGMHDLVSTRDATLDDFTTEIAMVVAELEM